MILRNKTDWVTYKIMDCGSYCFDEANPNRVFRKSDTCSPKSNLSFSWIILMTLKPFYAPVDYARSPRASSEECSN